MSNTNFLDNSFVKTTSTLFNTVKNAVTKEKVKLTSPLITYYRKLKAVFSEDPEVRIIFDADNCINNIFVDNPDKADAIATILPKSVKFGTLSVRNTVIPSNKAVTPVEGDVFERAFAGNSALHLVKTIRSEFMSNPMTFVQFTYGKQVQYFNDNAGSLDGITTALYEDLARDLFEVDGHFYSTQKGPTVVNLNSPLGEWP